MARQPWLKSFQNRLRTISSRQRRSTRKQVLAGQIEKVEERTLLAASVIFIGGRLQVLSDADDVIQIREDPASAGQLDVQVNGAAGVTASTIMTDQVTDIEITASAANNDIDLSGVTIAAFPNLSSILVRTGNGNDTITGSPDYGDVVEAGDGDDTIDGQGGNDSIDAGDGNDLVIGSAGDDTLNAGDGEDSIDGGDGLDVIDAGDGDDTVSGGADADDIFGGDGIDEINGDAGTDNISGGQGDDVLNGGTENDTIFGGAGNDAILGDEGNDSIVGNGGNDSLRGVDGDDTLVGGGGRDSLEGDIGNDSIVGGARKDTIAGGAGSDTIRGGAGSDNIIDEAITVLGSSIMTLSDDVIYGNGGDDTILSLSGADFIDAGTGDDLVDTLSNVLFSVDNVEIDEPDTGTVDLVFTISMSDALPVEASVDFQTVDGLATDGLDYTGQSGTVIFRPGQLTQTVTVPVIGDVINEADEPFFLNLSNPLNGTILDGQGEGRILDNDPLQIDVFLLFDDTGSFTGTAPTLASAFPQVISNLQSNFPTADVAFGVGRFEDYDSGGGFFGGDRPFILNQPIISDSDPQFSAAIDSALMRSSPGGGASFPESAIEGLFQVATGVGFDGNGDGDTNDSGTAGLVATQTMPGAGGDVPAYSTFTPDPSGPVIAPTHPVAMANDGVSFRPGSQRFILLATDAAFTVEPDNIDPYVGVGGVTVPATDINLLADLMSPGGRGATVQATVDELINRNIQVIGLGTSGFSGSPRTQLEGLATLTGAINNTGGTVENGITPGPSADDTQIGDPLFFQINTGDAMGLADSIVTAITAGANLTPPPPPLPPPPPPVFGNQDDTIFGGSGNDTVRAANSNDIIVGNAGDDSLEAGAGNDSVRGGAGNDTINGSLGDDTLFGQGGRDVIDGGEGEDDLGWRGRGDGSDLLVGGNGSDMVTIKTSSASNIISFGQDSDGNLTITEGAAVLTIDPTISNVVLNAGNGNDRITIGDVDRAGLISVRIRGDDGNDRVDASGAKIGSVRLRIEGGDGHDTLLGSTLADRIEGGNGRDSISGGGGSDILAGDVGADTISGDTGDDTVDGGQGDDSILGGTGNDHLSGGDDSDVVEGGDGHDTLLGGFGDDVLNGGRDHDSANGGSGRDTLFGAHGRDTLDGGRNDDTINGNSGDDLIRGNHGNDFINGSNGDDEIVGGDGHDTINGGNGADGINGNDGDDELVGNSGDDTIVGGDGHDMLIGGGNNDTLLGEQGDDTLTGNSGNDLGAGGEGVDVVQSDVETIDESFTLSANMLAKLDGV